MRKWLLTLGDFETELGTIAIAEWDGESLNVERLLSYEFPSAQSVYGKGFTGAQIFEGTLFICGFNTIYTMDLNTLTVQPWLIRDDFNDLHNLTILKDADGDVQVWVANTGHDRVDCFDFNGTMRSTTQLKKQPGSLPNNPSNPYFNSDSDMPIYCQKLYDKVHPNSIILWSSNILVSRFADKSIALLDGTTVYQLPAPPHDLSIWKDELWTTTTEGRVWRLLESEKQHELELVLDTFASTGRSGWCRGLAVHDDVLVVGFTRIVRMPRERWAERPYSETVTGLQIIDRATNRELAFSDLQWLGTHPKLFGVIPI